MAKMITTGVKELDAKLALLGPKIANKFARSALRKSGKLVLGTAQGNLDRNGSVISGKLRSGMRVRSAKRSNRGAGIEVMTSSGRHEDAGFGGAEVEFGTKHAAVHSFLRPAIYDNEVQVRQFFIDDVREQITEAARGVKQ